MEATKKKTTNKFSLEVRSRAVRMVREHRGVKWPREAGPNLGSVKLEVRLPDVFSSSR